MLYVLIFICLNGAQGCTYSMGQTTIVGDGDSVAGYRDQKSCQDEADRRNAIYNNASDIFEVCRKVWDVSGSLGK
jgi:hypothetical protein